MTEETESQDVDIEIEPPEVSQLERNGLREESFSQDMINSEEMQTEACLDLENYKEMAFSVEEIENIDIEPDSLDEGEPEIQVDQEDLEADIDSLDEEIIEAASEEETDPGGSHSFNREQRSSRRSKRILKQPQVLTYDERGRQTTTPRKVQINQISSSFANLRSTYRSPPPDKIPKSVRFFDTKVTKECFGSNQPHQTMVTDPGEMYWIPYTASSQIIPWGICKQGQFNIPSSQFVLPRHYGQNRGFP